MEIIEIILALTIFSIGGVISANIFCWRNHVCLRRIEDYLDLDERVDELERKLNLLPN